MKIMILLLLTFVVSLTSCLKNELTANEGNVRVSNQANTGKTSNSQISKSVNNANSNQRVPSIQVNDKKQKKEQSTVSLKELKELLANHFANFLLVDSYHPSYIQGDFNGDKNQDVALVIGAQDRYGESGALTDIADNLCFAGVDTSFQNMRTNAFLAAHPKQNCSIIEAKKSAFQAKYSQYGLLIIFGNQNGWREVLKQNAFGQKYLLLDAIFKTESQESLDSTDKLITVSKPQVNQPQQVDRDCLPLISKGDGIFSGELEAGGKVIYFDGKKFAWIQCGD